MKTKPIPSVGKKSIFLVEDDERLAALVQEYLENEGFNVSHEIRGDLAVYRLIEEQPDLLILDLMLPGLDGFEVYKKIRADFNGVVLMLTARDDDIDQILGLELGADDYVIKPIQPRVLLARINTLLRRHEKANHPNEAKQLIFGSLKINMDSRQVTLSGFPIDLTTNEFELLWYLANHAGETMSREKILTAIRRIEYDGQDRWVDIRISHLRNKLGDDTEHPQKIKTVWSKGYLFVRDAW
ncbi:MAG: response regulator [Methylococcales bacterium]|nr:response regulator [Methylococcales bacterium]